MKILITGGSGFIGRALCSRLLALGDELIVLSRQSKLFKQLGAPDNLSVIHQFDDLEEDCVIDGVINLAGEPIADFWWTKRRKKKLLDSRVGITEQLSELIARLKKKPVFLINGSAVGYYGNDENTLFDEFRASTSERDFAQELCSSWESSATHLASRHNMRLCIVRIGLVIGPVADGGFLKKLILPFKLGLGGRLGSGQQWMSWIHRDDLVEVLTSLIEDKSAEGVYNGVSPSPMTNKQFTEALAGVLKRPAVISIPAWFLRLAVGEMSVILVGGQRVLPKRLNERSFLYRYEKIDDALLASV